MPAVAQPPAEPAEDLVDVRQSGAPVPPTVPAGGRQPPPPPKRPPPGPGTPVVVPAPQAAVHVPSPDGGGDEEFDEIADWRRVYEEFISLKRQCGEDTGSLTFEKFKGTLQRNKDALVQRHGCSRVKFTVYVKEGKAGLPQGVAGQVMSDGSRRRCEDQDETTWLVELRERRRSAWW